MLYWALTLHKNIFGGIFICNGPVAFRNGILSRIIGQSRAFFIGSESWKRSIAWKVSDRVRVDGVGAKFLFFSGFCSFPIAEDQGTIDSSYLEMCRKHSNLLKRIKRNEDAKNKEKQRKTGNKKRWQEEKRKKGKTQNRNNQKKRESAKTQAKCKHDRETQKNTNSLQPHQHQSH